MYYNFCSAAPGLPRDCYDVAEGTIENEVYNITLPNNNIVEVYCDVQQGGWTVIQKYREFQDL